MMRLVRTKFGIINTCLYMYAGIRAASIPRSFYCISAMMMSTTNPTTKQLQNLWYVLDRKHTVFFSILAS